MARLPPILLAAVLFVALAPVQPADARHAIPAGMTDLEYIQKVVEATGPNTAPQLNVSEKRVYNVSKPVSLPRSTATDSCTGTFTSTVKKVVDGDTISVKGCNRKVELALVDTPEIWENRTAFREARDLARSVCPQGAAVVVDQERRQRYDKYGRILAAVYCDDQSLNSLVVYAGLGKINTKLCKSSEFSEYSWSENECAPYISE